MFRVLAAFMFLILTACSDAPTFAPVYEISDLEHMITRYTALAPPSLATKKTAVIEPPEFNKSVTGWQWPVSPAYKHVLVTVNKGVDIQGTLGEPIYAAADGKVVYAGHGLRGYGQLIIIKHNNKYLSVYAHNQQLIAKQGAWVKRGQNIANMGSSGTNSTKLHFEIRRLGKPINPLILARPKPV